MTSTYPASVDTSATFPSTIAPTTPQSGPSHSQLHNDLSVATLAIEALLGANGLNYPQASAFLNACRAKTNASQTISTGVPTAILLPAEDFDGNTMHDLVTNNSRITCKLAGKYMAVGGLYWDAQVLGTVTVLLVRLAVNGTTLEASRQHVSPLSSFAANGQGQISTAIVQLALNDYVEMQCQHDKTAAGTLTIGATGFPSALMLAYLGP